MFNDTPARKTDWLLGVRISSREWVSKKEGRKERRKDGRKCFI